MDRRGGGQERAPFPCFTVDMTDERALASLVEGVDVVVHTAALHGLHLRTADPNMFFTNNVLSFFHLLRACSSNKVPQLVFTSSTSLYGASVQRPQGRAVWYHSPSPVTCCDLYDCTKLLAEQLCESLAQKESIGVTVLRVARFFVEEEISFNLCKLFRTVDLRDVVRAAPRGGPYGYRAGLPGVQRRSQVAILRSGGRRVLP